MRKVLLTVLLVLLSSRVFAQVDVESRRVLMMQTELGVNHSDEQPSAFGYYWYNQNNFPWTNTALRVIFAGVFLDSELSYFLNPNTAVGAGLGGGLYLDSDFPYLKGEYIGRDSFYGDLANGRVFLNQTIPNPTPLPINLRGTYGISGSLYRGTSETKNFDVPDDYLTQFVSAELRIGGIEPGLTAVRGAELYLSVDANYRSGYTGFGPDGALYPVHDEYDRFFGSLSGKIPLGPTVFYPRLAGGLGSNLDQLSAWKIGGNLINIDPFAYTLHGYYTRELFAEDFVLANLAWNFPICSEHGITGNLYADWALLRPPPPEPADWNHYFGVGTGVGFTGPWKSFLLVGYGYGFNAIRDGEHGGHEVSFALEKKF